MYIRLPKHVSKYTKLKSILINSLLTVIVFSPFVNVASADGSSDVIIFKANYLDCVDDSRLECVLPIRADVSHDFSVRVLNGLVQESYVFHQDIVDDSTGSIVDSDTSAITLSLIHI